MRVVQLSDPECRRRVAIVDGSRLVLVSGYGSVYEIAQVALSRAEPLADTVAWLASSDALDYEPVWDGESGWTLLVPFDHPESPAYCSVSGTGLTHLRSAQSRDSMHTDSSSAAPSDSLRMYNLGLEGGRPAPGHIGVQPEWFYKGSGAVLRPHGATLDVPAFAIDGGDEAEIAGCYVIGLDGVPYRIGFAQGNEFSDHAMERQNYLYLAPSKLRTCALGPELALNANFDDVRGRGRVLRGGEAVWEKDLATGERNMCHSLENLEHHHFKYPQHRERGHVHVHYFGAGAFSFSSGVALDDGDVMEVAFEGFGRPLRNAVRVDGSPETIIRVRAL